MDPFTSFFRLPKLRVLKSYNGPDDSITVEAESTSTSSVCGNCASLCHKIHDYQKSTVRETDHVKKKVKLKIKKKRYRCENCKKVHTEYIPGISYRAKTTERFRRWVFEECLRASSLSLAAKKCRVSIWFVFNYFHQMLRVKLKEFNNPWPKYLGIDEHSFRRNKQTGEVEFVTVFVDHVNKRIRKIVLGRDRLTLIEAIKNISGAQHVKAVSIDLSGGYREFVKEAFPKALIVEDKFHVMRLFGKVITRARIDIFGDKRKTELFQLLKTSRKKLGKKGKEKLDALLLPHPKIREAYLLKVKMYEIYRKSTISLAQLDYSRMLEGMKLSNNPYVHTLRLTLYSWKEEILNYFKVKITNARVEAFNNICKKIKRKAHGYRNVENYANRCLGETLLL